MFKKLLNFIVNVVSPVPVNLFPDDTNPTVVNIDDIDFDNPNSINAFNLQFGYPSMQDIQNEVIQNLADGVKPSDYNTNVVEQFYNSDLNLDGTIGISNVSTKNQSNSSSLYLIGAILFLFTLTN